MKTKEQAVRKWRKMMGSTPAIVYQFDHSGKWMACSVDSPNAEAIRANGQVGGYGVSEWRAI